MNAEVIALVPASQDDDYRIDGVTLVPVPIDRKTNSPFALIAEAILLARMLRKLNPEIVVAYSLRICVVAALAQRLVWSSKFVFGVTGLGLLAFANKGRSRVVRMAVFWLLRQASRSRSHFLFENPSDPAAIGIVTSGHPFSILMGAGVDPDEFRNCDLPRGRPFRIATVSRLVWSKGIDMAVSAVSSLARAGHSVELHIYGAPDPANPRPVDIGSFTDAPGVHYHGFSSDIDSLWEGYHAAIFASRGGEGLPRALLEAAASGRPTIVTDVPGCRDFVRNGVEGLVVPPSDAALKNAILQLMSVSDDELRQMGERARERVQHTSTVAYTKNQYEEVFGSLVQETMSGSAAAARHVKAKSRSTADRRSRIDRPWRAL